MNNASRQSGATLFMSLIMLVVLTLFVVSAITTSTVNLRIVGNVQTQAEAKAAAQLAIEEFYSVKANFTAPPAVDTVTNIDINNDGTNDYKVTIEPPVCLQSVPFPNNSALLPPADRNTFWDLTATVADITTNTTDVSTILHQGVRVALSVVQASTACPVP